MTHCWFDYVLLVGVEEIGVVCEALVYGLGDGLVYRVETLVYGDEAFAAAEALVEALIEALVEAWVETLVLDDDDYLILMVSMMAMMAVMTVVTMMMMVSSSVWVHFLLYFINDIRDLFML